MAAWPPTITDCECEDPGFCKRHHCFKGFWQHRLCRRQPKVFAAFEKGEGPCLHGSDEEGETTSGAPGLLQRSLNFTRAAMRHVADGMEAVSETIVEQRLEICRACESCDVDRMVCQRPECGCFLKVKAKWRSETCPSNKWPMIERES